MPSRRSHHDRVYREYPNTDKGAVAEMRDLIQMLLTRELLANEKAKERLRARFAEGYRKSKDWHEQAVERRRKGYEKHRNTETIEHHHAEMRAWLDRYELVGGNVADLDPEEALVRERQKMEEDAEKWGAASAVPPDPAQTLGAIPDSDLRVIGRGYPEDWLGDFTVVESPEQTPPQTSLDESERTKRYRRRFEREARGE